jgi:hypothetical protein
LCSEVRAMDVEVVQDKISVGVWRVELVNHELDGEIYVTMFSGPMARLQADRCAALAPTDREELLEQIEDYMDLEEVRKRLNEPTIPLADVKRELGL